MLEIPESTTIARQLNETITGKIISYVKANQSPHSFAWYFEDPAGYDELLSGKRFEYATSWGGMVEMKAEDCRILIGDGVCIRYHDDLKKIPKKHQLYIEFDDGTALVCTLQMYGGLWAYKEGENHNPYYVGAKEKPSPLSEGFSLDYFMNLINEKTLKLSAKAFLATEQRIPGLGNGVLQDILYLSHIHPKRKLSDLSKEECITLYDTIKKTLADMISLGGRDTEKDLFGKPGRYMTYLSKKTVGTPCFTCGCEISKESYMGGSIYFCRQCQPNIY